MPRRPPISLFASVSMARQPHDRLIDLSAGASIDGYWSLTYMSRQARVGFCDMRASANDARRSGTGCAIARPDLGLPCAERGLMEVIRGPCSLRIPLRPPTVRIAEFPARALANDAAAFTAILDIWATALPVTSHACQIDL